jgi:hypothetical protein
LITNLIGNLGRAKAEEQHEKTTQLAQRADMLKYLAFNADAPPEVRQAAQGNLLDLLEGQGKQGKAAARAIRDVMPTGPATPSSLAGYSPGGAGVSAGLTGVGGGAGVTPATLMGWTPGGVGVPGQPVGGGVEPVSLPPAQPLSSTALVPQAVPRRSPFGSVLHTLAGIGTGLVGVPQGQQLPPLRYPIPRQMEMTAEQREAQDEQGIARRRKQGERIGLRGDALSMYELTGKLPSDFGKRAQAR